MSKRARRPIKGKTVITEKIVLTSLEPVLVQDWIVKISGNDLGHILLTMFNPYTKESCMHYFLDEIEANAFITTWVEKHSSL
jgi:hypothetical protein